VSHSGAAGVLGAWPSPGRCGFPPRWLENRSGKGGVAYTICTAGGERCTPNEAVNDAPFASYGMKRHCPEWLSEYNALVVDPARRTLHAVWTQTVAARGKPTARLFHASAPLR
jgi:hypothetical protein